METEKSYIDIHSHILPEMDDGPPSLEAAVALAQAFVEKGFRTVIATPHCTEGSPSVEAIMAAVEALNRALSDRRIPLRVLPGAEHALEPRLMERLAQGALLTLNRGRYLLIELPLLQPLPPYTRDMLFALRAHGYYPLLAHPERVKAFQDDLALLAATIRSGAYAQLTLGSLTGAMGPEAHRTAAAMLKGNLVHFLATDAHRPGVRLDETERAARLLEQAVGAGSAAFFLKKRPLELLNDRPVAVPDRAATAAERERSERGKRWHRFPIISKLFAGSEHRN